MAISAELSRMVDLVLMSIFLAGFSLFGTIANIINIAVFIKQGFKDTVTISFFGLAISDLGSLLTMVFTSILYNPAFHYSDKIPWESHDIQYITVGWPHVCFARVTSWITAFVTFERCVCIALPLKVRHIITIRRTVLVMAIIYLTAVATILPVIWSIGIGWKYIPHRNKTLIGLTYSENREEIEDACFAINFANQVVTLVIVIICTVILIYNLYIKSKWRRKATAVTRRGGDDKVAALPSREMRVVKMVTFISCVFIVCYTPSLINLPMMVTYPQESYNIGGEDRDLFKTHWAFMFNLEAINSSVNIFIYYRLSSKFRAVFRNMFCREPIPQ